jgi:YHS domain-containing protein
MIRVLFYTVLLILFVRAMTRLWNGIVEGATGAPPGSSRVPQRAVPMARDPVCGTFVVPDLAVALSIGREHLYFCSTSCRDRYQARTG